MLLERILFISFCVALGLGLVSNSNSEISPSPMMVRQVSRNTFPIAIYKNIKVDDLSKLLVDSFSEFNFSLLAAKKNADGIMDFDFSYPIYTDGKPNSIIFRFKVDGTVTSKRCMNCFLRGGWIQDEKSIEKLPWMIRYDLNSRLYPDIDRSYLAVKNKSETYIDRQHGFQYASMRSGEGNRFPFSNSYVNIQLPDLKREIARGFTDSGFVLLRDSNPALDAVVSTMVFSFPIKSGSTSGAVYSVRLENQFDSNGHCYPCEASGGYDPHQTLPPHGLSAMADRLTLASRFESSLNAAYDQIKASTERHLRPKTQFVRPRKYAPLGTPRPPLAPPVVT